jgi:hypothetical protein
MTPALQRSRWKWAAPLAAAIALLAFASSASAARDPISSGTTDLHMKNGFLRKLANLGVTVQPLGVSTVSGKKIGLSVRDGMLDPTDAKGFLETRGGFKLELGGRGVPVTQVVVNSASMSVSAKIAKARMQLGVLTPPTFSREGFGANFKAVKLSLTEKATRRISNRLGLRGSKRLNPGRALSNLYSTAQPETVTVLPKGSSATLKLSAAAIEKFVAKGVKEAEGITAIAPATEPKPTSFQLPVKAGTLALDAGMGALETTGGLQVLKEGESFSPTLRLRNVSIDFTQRAATAELELLPKPPFPGPAGRSAVVSVTLPPDSVTVDPVSRTIVIQGPEARLQAGTASTLNDVFNQPAPPPPPSSNFVVGDPLGTFSLTLQAQ